MKKHGHKPAADAAPASLSGEARTLWRRLRDGYSIDDAAGLLLLGTAVEAFDRMRQAQAQLAADGLTIKDRHGTAKSHPCCAVEVQSRTAMLAALKALRLDLEPLGDGPGRPPEY